MNNAKKVFEIIQKTTNNLPSDVRNNDIFLRKIPYRLLSKGLFFDEVIDQIEPIITEFGLDDPQKLIKWLIELHFAGIESINEGITSIRHDLLTTEMQKISSVIDMIEDINYYDDRDALIKKYTDKLIGVISDIEGKVKNYISEIDRIDNLPKYRFFLQANFNKSKVTASVQLAKAALQAYFEALYIQAILSNERHGTDSNKQKNYLEKRMSFIESLKISLVYEYDKNKDSEFWDSSKLKGRINDIKQMSYKINEYLECEVETEVENFEIIDFS